MIKKRQDLTESDKQKFYKAVVEEHNNAFDIPWSNIERDMERFLDEAFDDTLLTKRKLGACPRLITIKW